MEAEDYSAEDLQELHVKRIACSYSAATAFMAVGATGIGGATSYASEKSAKDYLMQAALQQAGSEIATQASQDKTGVTAVMVDWNLAKLEAGKLAKAANNDAEVNGALLLAMAFMTAAAGGWILKRRRDIVSQIRDIQARLNGGDESVPLSVPSEPQP